MQKTLHFRSGFTLIELLISIGILLLIVGAGIAGYIRLNDRQTLLNAAKELQVMLRSAQKKARVGDKPPGCTKLLSYSVTTQVATGGQALLKAECENTSYTVDTLQFPASVSIDEKHVLRFYVLQGGTQNSQTFILRSNGGTYSFDVDQGGSISEGALQTVGTNQEQ
jgi:prepilin-type N-terminal cleavage/methylation domain-containing protein